MSGRGGSVAATGAARRVVALLIGLLLAAGGVWYGHAPPRSTSAYLDRAELTAEALRSQARVAALWVRAVDGKRVTRQAATVAFEDTETDAQSTATRFAGWVPPVGMDESRGKLTASADELVALLGSVRIAAVQGQWARLPGYAGQLDLLADRLDGQLKTLRARR